MEKKIVITKEMLLNANTYVPLMQKKEITEALSERCIGLKPMAIRLDDGETIVSLPDRFQEAKHLSAMFQMGVFAKLYLKQEFLGEDDFQMAALVYDDWAGSHVFNQMERYKTDKDVKEIVQDILSDFKEFQWMIRKETETLVAHKNDVVTRFALMLNALASEVPPQLKELLQQRSGESASDSLMKEIAQKREEINKMMEAQATVAEAGKELDKAVELAKLRAKSTKELLSTLKANSGDGSNVRSDKQ